MSHLISRIILSILLFPLAGLVYLVAFVVYVENAGWGPGRESGGFMAAGVVAWAFIAAYWFGLWRKTVRWTGDRRVCTVLAFPGALLAAAVLGGIVGQMEDELGFFVATVAAPLLWQVGTVLFWRESAEERRERLSSTGREGVVCPSCGYNLTGLKGTRCPECGAEFTLDELLASQPGREGAEVEG